ncbi:facilitated trehalose transporter Tret1-like [Aricia agestis]|uniref:facilitated trehalose transporter Tret1-like n=1 Tax=Aricia agestis TaxID=91739 RepID=UPI001C202B3E|nr:facilitated trehalose transporter Tret1-like [Aricia agestis]
MSQPAKRTVQYLAGLCVSFAFSFTGATLCWASPAIPKLKSGEANLLITDSQISWAVSLAHLGALPGCYVGKILSERVGRKRTVFYSAVPGFIGSGVILWTSSPEVLCAARFLVGIGIGITAVVTMIYLTEIADKEIRGALGMLVQVMINLGGLAVYGLGPFVSYTALNSMVLFISVFYAVICLWVPESPYYHLTNDDVDAARKSLKFIKGSTDDKWVDEQLESMRVHVSESMAHKTTVKELLTNTRYRKNLYIVAGLKIMQYMTGSLVIQSYLEMIFKQSASISRQHASIVYGFVQLATGICATFITDRFGRRQLMLCSSFGVAVSLTVIGTYFFLQDNIQVSPGTLASISAMPLVGVLSFNVLYATGLGNIPYIMQAELFPINVKLAASSLATMLACVLNFLITKSYQGIKDAFGHFSVFWCFACVGYLGMFFIYFCVPETKGKTLEEVHDNLKEDGTIEAEPLNKKLNVEER